MPVFSDLMMCFPPGDRTQLPSFFLRAIPVITTDDLVWFPIDESNIRHELMNMADSNSSNTISNSDTLILEELTPVSLSESDKKLKDKNFIPISRLND